MIERMARAACAENARRVARAFPDLKIPAAWEDDPQSLRDDWKACIRAALAAARDPTDAMIDAAWASAHEENATGVWTSMIDEALR